MPKKPVSFFWDASLAHAMDQSASARKKVTKGKSDRNTPMVTTGIRDAREAKQESTYYAAKGVMFSSYITMELFLVTLSSRKSAMGGILLLTMSCFMAIDTVNKCRKTIQDGEQWLNSTQPTDVPTNPNEIRPKF